MNRALCILAALAVVGTPFGARAAVDLSGVWQVINPPAALLTIDGTPPPLLPDAKTLYDKYRADKAKGDRAYDPMQECKAPGEPRILLQPDDFKIVQNKKQVWFFYSWNNLIHWVNLNKAPDPNAFTTYFGSSTGRFDGKTLVVHSELFNDFTLLDNSGLPHSAQLTLTERYSLADGGKHLIDDITVHDPKVFSRPWKTELTFRRLPTDRVGLDVCEDRIDTSKFY